MLPVRTGAENGTGRGGTLSRRFGHGTGRADQGQQQGFLPKTPWDAVFHEQPAGPCPDAGEPYDRDPAEDGSDQR